MKQIEQRFSSPDYIDILLGIGLVSMMFGVMVAGIIIYFKVVRKK
jgi:hypothetical protein